MYVAYSEDKVYKDVGDTSQLFIDNDVIAVVKNVTRRQHTPKKHPDNPLIRRDKPWEGNTYFRTSCFNVAHDRANGMFQSWYQDFYEYGTIDKFNFTEQTLRGRIYYAYSEDGLNWKKPVLGKHHVDGHDTNTVFGHPPYAEVICPSVLLDEQESDPSRRYKMLYLFHDPNVKHAKLAYGGEAGGGLRMAFSPNGIDWTPYEGNPVIPDWISDVQILTWDPIDRKYVLWGRYGGSSGGSGHPAMDNWFCPVVPGKPEGVWGVRRRIYRTESTDVLNWPKPELLWDPGEEANLDDGYYGFVPWRAGDMHLGLLNVLHQVDNTVDMYLHYSRDGVNWNQMLDHRPLIDRGAAGSYDEFDVEMPTQPLVVGDEIRFYYGGMNVHHDWWIVGAKEGLDVPEAKDPTLGRDGHHLCLATLRLDGYVSLDATVREGWVETKPLFSTGANLYINGVCEPNGYIQVEVMDGWNNVWSDYSREKCETFTGDSVRHHVRWAGRESVNLIPGAVKLRFHLKNASLYSFQFADS